MRKNIFAVTIALTLLIASVSSTTTISSYTSANNPVCSSPGTLSLEPSDLKYAGASGLNFDWATTYLDADGDSAPLLVTRGDGSSVGYKFISYTDNTLTSAVDKECSGTATGEFIGLLNGILVLKVGSDYQTCIFSPSAVSVKTLTFPTTLLSTIYKIWPYYVDGTTLYIMATDNTSSAVHSFDTSATSPITGTAVSNFLFNIQIQN